MVVGGRRIPLGFNEAPHTARQARTPPAHHKAARTPTLAGAKRVARKGQEGPSQAIEGHPCRDNSPPPLNAAAGPSLRRMTPNRSQEPPGPLLALIVRQSLVCASPCAHKTDASVQSAHTNPVYVAGRRKAMFDGNHAGRVHPVGGHGAS
jgi:hypothetical protein